jgi:integration host factor subunit beta
VVRHDLIDSLAKAFPGITKRDMLAMVESLFESMAHALSRGETVEMRGLGRFKVKERDPGTARNPKTEKRVHMPKRWVVRFKAADSLIRDMNAYGAPLSEHHTS